MYGDNTRSVDSPNTKDAGFHDVLERAAETIFARLRNYDEKTDPLKRSHLKLLWDIVMLEVDRVAAGDGRYYTGLESPIKAVRDWGEPADSDLTTSLWKAERYFHQNYRGSWNRKRSAVDADRGQTRSDQWIV